MRCFKPLTAWQTDDGSVVFVERGSIRRELTLRCGQCIGCRIERSRQWAVRIMHESQLYDVSSFVTLTYDDSHFFPSLDYLDFQKFMRRLRKRVGPARFFMCGEYGERFQRPHFHAILFGVDFPDKAFFKDLPSGGRLYTSALLQELWPFGFSSIGDVTFESAAYVARYCVKKVTGSRAERHYERVWEHTGEVVSVVPEFARMSLKPGIGFEWFRRFSSDVLVRDAVVVHGVPGKVPRYYDKLMQDMDSVDWDGIEYERFQKALSVVADNSPARLGVLEAVAKARVGFKVRNLE